MQTLHVHTPDHSYPIHIGTGLLQNAATHLRPHLTHRVAIVSNTTVAPLYLHHIQNACDQLNIPHTAIILPDGEQHKNSDTLNQIYTALLQHHADRKTTLIALGGGVIGDTAGYAAATYQRGIPFIQIPTTLLSQVDSSVGGKTGINHPLGKNMIGAFYQPQAVLADTDCLHTLPPREYAAGLAEVVKYALLGDANFLDWLEQHSTDINAKAPQALAHLIHHSCQMKAHIVEQDEKEHGIRAHLNLGHTFGHAIEAHMGYGNWLHGEAVAAGMVLAARLSQHRGHLKPSDTQRIIQLLHTFNLPTTPPDIPTADWLKHMSHDKKNQNGQIRLILLQQIGQAIIESGFDLPTLEHLLTQSQQAT